MKNPIWVTTDNVYLMYCETNTLCKLCELSYNEIKKFEKIRDRKIHFIVIQILGIFLEMEENYMFTKSL